MRISELDQAIKRARRQAIASGEDRYIVYSDEYDQGYRYHVCDEYELETFFCGQPVSAVVDSCGEVEDCYGGYHATDNPAQYSE